MLAPEAEEKKYAGKPYYETKRRGPGRGTALAFLGERLLVVGPALGVERVLDRKPGATSAGLKLAAGKHAVVAEIHLAPFKEVLPALPEAAKPLEPLLQAQDGTLTIVGDADTKADLRLTFADDDQAKQGEKAVQAALDMARKGLAEMRRGNEPQPRADPEERGAGRSGPLGDSSRPRPCSGKATTPSRGPRYGSRARSCMCPCTPRRLLPRP